MKDLILKFCFDDVAFRNEVTFSDRDAIRISDDVATDVGIELKKERR